MKREVVELLLGRKFSGDEWLKACSLPGRRELEPTGAASMRRRCGRARR